MSDLFDRICNKMSNENDINYLECSRQQVCLCVEGRFSPLISPYWNRIQTPRCLRTLGPLKESIVFMKPPVPSYIQNLKPYVAGKTIAEVKEAYNPPRIAKLASNENRMGCSPQAKAAAIQALDVVQDYPDPQSRKLRAALAAHHRIPENEIVCAGGSEGVMTLFTRAFLREGDHVVTASATFIGFLVLANIQGVELERVPITSDFRFDADGILKAVRKDTKAVYLANPNNPTGTYLNKTELTRLLEAIPATTLILLDEAYIEYAKYLGDYPDGMDFRRDNMIILRTFSKAYGLAGLRVGYGVGPANLIEIMTRIKPPFEPSVTAQWAALAALADQDFIQRSVALVNRGRDRLIRFCEKHNLNWAGNAANSVMIVFASEAQAEQFTQKLLERGVIVRRLPGFGLPNCVRVTIGLDEEMDWFEEVAEKVVEDISKY